MLEDQYIDRRSFYQVIRESQAHWRSQPRGRLSRPWEVPGIAKLTDRMIKQTFAGYLDQERPPLRIAWSVLVDQPLTKPKFVQMPRRVDGVTRENQDNFHTGIIGLNDWMTNYATRAVFSCSDFSGVGSLYGRLNDDLVNRHEYKDTYALMGQIRKDSRVDGLSFRDAILSSLFKHDSAKIDWVVFKANLKGVKTIEDLAIYLGQASLQDRAQVALLSRLGTQQREDSDQKQLLKRVLFSLSIGGIYSTLGVVEVITASATGLLALSLPMMMVSSNKSLVLGLSALASGSIFAMTPFSAIHEAIHEYSASPNYVGLIPTTLEKVD